MGDALDGPALKLPCKKALVAGGEEKAPNPVEPPPNALVGCEDAANGEAKPV